MDNLEIKWQRAGRSGKVEIAAKLADEILHSDVITIGKDLDRERFLTRLCEDRPGIDRAAVSAELLKIAGDVMNLGNVANEPAAESMETPRLVRPELIITPDVVGLAVAETILIGGKPAGRWRLYLAWKDGRRESIDLPDCITLPDGGRLWLHPKPGDPSPSMPCGWTIQARRQWVNGSADADLLKTFAVICTGIAEYIELPDNEAQGIIATLALWTMLTYVYPAWPAVPYLYVGGPLGSGKTRVFEILQRLVFRPLVSSNMTAAALFRTLHERGGTGLLDEAERLRESTPEATELRSILLSGYKRGGRATRLEAVGDSFKTMEFDTFGPKALACIAGLPPALLSRCIGISMFRAAPGSPKPKRRVDADPRWAALRDDLHALALGPLGRAALDLAQRENVCPLGGRDYELWQPLMAIANLVQEAGADGLLALVQEHAQRSVEAAQEDQTPEADELLLRILAEAVIEAAESPMTPPPTPGRILAVAQEREPELFERWMARSVATHLKRYALITIKTSRERSYRDVTRGQLLKVQRHYGIDLGLGPDAGHTPGDFAPLAPLAPENPAGAIGNAVLTDGANDGANRAQKSALSVGNPAGGGKNGDFGASGANGAKK